MGITIIIKRVNKTENLLIVILLIKSENINVPIITHNFIL